MLFNSLDFLIFFPIVVGIHFLIPYRFRWVWLLAASYYFYMAWKAEYVVLIIASTLIDYFCSIQMEKSQDQRWRRGLLLLSLTTNLGLLFTFKYLNFFSHSVNALLNQFNVFYNVPFFDLLLPVGISFYTFQTLSYTIDVYRRQIKAERHLGKFALYVTFFPQLVAGPIERSAHLIPQFYQQQNFDYERVLSGLKQMAWGFFKKLVIADKAAIFVNAVYNNPTDYTGLPLILATYLFAFQIYCDFSGYSDIAIGAARVLGFDLMENFKQPYLSRSIPEFWRRWHISLSTWFKDYLYIPLGGNRVPYPQMLANLMIVFVVSGLWHGANWTFVIWGALHGTFIVASLVVQPLTQKLGRFFESFAFGPLYDVFKTFVTFHLVVFAWIFFRANSLQDALYICTHLFADLGLKLSGYGVGLGVVSTGILFLAIVLMGAVEFVRQKGLLSLARRPTMMRWAAYYALIMFILLFGELQSKSQFIYFQF